MSMAMGWPGWGRRLRRRHWYRIETGQSLR